MFFRQENKIVTAIDIGTASIKSVAIIRDGERLLLNNYNEIYSASYVGKDVGQYAKMGYLEMGKIISDSYNELKVKTDLLVMGIPASECIFKNVKIPTHVLNATEDKNLIDNIIKLEFKKNTIGLDILNYNFTFSEINQNQNEREYLVLAIKKEYISNISSIASSINKNYIIEPNIFGGIAMLPHEIGVNNVLLNIGANNINIVFINDGKIVGVENIEQGINKVIFNVKTSMLLGYREARESVFAFDYLNEEDLILKDIIKLSTINLINDIIDVLNRYELRYNVKYNKVYIGGSSAKILNTKIFYENHLKKEVAIMRPFERIEMPQVLQDSLVKDSAVFMNSIGLAINHVN